MLLNQASLETIQRYCNHHRQLLQQSTSAGCLCCGATFSPAEIREWIEEMDLTTGRPIDDTAKCPRCGVGSVLPSAAPVTLDPSMFAAMQAFWFKGPH